MSEVYVAIVSVVALLFGLRMLMLQWRLKHEWRIPTGNFRLPLPKKQWDEGFKKGAFAVAFTNKDNAVMFTLVIEQEVQKP